MIRKLLALLCCLLLAASCALADTTPYTVKDIGVTVNMPNDYNIVLTIGMDENDPAFATLGLTRDFVDSFLTQNGVCLDAMVYTAAGATKELTLVAQYMSDLASIGMTSLNLLDDSSLPDFIAGLQESYTLQALTITEYDIYRTNDLTFVLLMVQSSTGINALQAITVEDSTMYCLSVNNYLGAIEEADVLQMVAMMDSFTIAP